MFIFRKPKRFCGLLPDRRGWFSVLQDGKRIGYVRRESAGRWIASVSRVHDDGQRAVIGATRDAAAEALSWRLRAGAEGTGEQQDG